MKKTVAELINIRTLKQSILTLMLSILLISSFNCSDNQAIIDTKKLKESIDSLSINEVVIELKVDKFDNVLDTLSINNYKIDKDSIIRYSECFWNNQFGESFSKQYHFNDDIVFYQESNQEDGRIKSVYEAELIEPGIENRIRISTFTPDMIDTMIIEFDNKFGFNGKLNSSTSIFISGSDTTIIQSNYNAKGKIEFQTQLINNEVFEEWNFKYRDNNNKLESVKMNYFGDTLKVLYKYDEFDKLISEESQYGIIYKSNHSISRYIYNENGKLLKRVKKDLIVDSIEYTKFIRIN